ncbi:hypothetical protein EYV94_23360 [Puteibacter caeruleilacunae]|nr:hypothetical protein EYV94_23360 [Puteibacter caeruleilacunae]
MTRLEFLQTLWYKLFKPLLLFVTVCFCLFFLRNAVFENSIERFLIVGTAVYLGVGLVIYFIPIFFNRLQDEVFSRASQSVKMRLRQINRVYDVMIPFVYLILAYFLWINEYHSVSVTTAVGAVYLIWRLFISKRNKQT